MPELRANAVVAALRARLQEGVAVGSDGNTPDGLSEKDRCAIALNRSYYEATLCLEEAEDEAGLEAAKQARPYIDAMIGRLGALAALAGALLVLDVF